MKTTKFSIPIYFGYLQIIVTESFNDAAIKFKVNNQGKDLDYYYGAFVDVQSFGNGQDFFNVFFKPNPHPALIAHEVVHLVNRLYIERGMDLDKHNDENQAYLTGWFTEKIYKALKL